MSLPVVARLARQGSTTADPAGPTSARVTLAHVPPFRGHTGRVHPLPGWSVPGPIRVLPTFLHPSLPRSLLRDLSHRLVSVCLTASQTCALRVESRAVLACASCRLSLPISVISACFVRIHSVFQCLFLRVSRNFPKNYGWILYGSSLPRARTYARTHRQGHTGKGTEQECLMQERTCKGTLRARMTSARA